MNLVIKEVSSESAAAQRMIDALWNEIKQRYNFDSPCDMMPEDFMPPKGKFWIAFDSDEPVGSIALKHLNNNIGELDAMYVVPQKRGENIAQRLLGTLEEHAKHAALSELVLRAGTGQPEAMRFYEREGFVLEDCPDRYDESDGTRCFRKKLGMAEQGSSGNG